MEIGNGSFWLHYYTTLASFHDNVTSQQYRKVSLVHLHTCIADSKRKKIEKNSEDEKQTFDHRTTNVCNAKMDGIINNGIFYYQWWWVAYFVPLFHFILKQKQKTKNSRWNCFFLFFLSFLSSSHLVSFSPTATTSSAASSFVFPLFQLMLLSRSTQAIICQRFYCFIFVVILFYIENLLIIYTLIKFTLVFLLLICLFFIFFLRFLVFLLCVSRKI